MTTLSPIVRQSRIGVFGIVAGLLAAGALFAQSPTPRIHSAINSSQTSILPGSRHPLAIPQYDSGRVPADTRLKGVTLYFARSAAQQADLNRLLAAQQDPSSPQYHKWLTPEQFGARFGVAQSDIDKVQAWLQQQGFSVDSVMHSRTGIRFSGTTAQIESAFQTQLHYYTLKGEKHFAPSTDLSVPAALAGVVAGVRNLDDFRPKPQHVISHRNFTSGQTGNVFFSPGDIVTAYDVQPLYTAGVNGNGQTIAIMGQSWVDVKDIEAFQSAAGLTKKDPSLTLVPNTGSDGVPSPGDESESDLDLEWSGAIAPGANIVFVYTGSDNSFGVYDSAQYAVDNKIGNIISLSYSSCETELDSSSVAALESITMQATAQGQTVLAASGDQGSTACFGDNNLSILQQNAIQVNYPASSAYVTGVGGTEIPTSDGVDPITGTKGANYSTYWSSGSGGNDDINSAKQYIPEITWNDDDPGFGLSSTGGGASAIFGKPSYQTQLTPQDGRRDVPDIAFYSSPDLPGYLYCTSDQSAWSTGTPTQTSSCTSGFRDSSSGLLTVAGGTSFATPIFAGMVALLNDKLNYASGQGLINPTLYQLASDSATYAAAFHDVTSGNNDCTAGVSYCGATTGGFTAGTGYDQVTGLGSVDMAVLAAAWPASGSATLTGTVTTILPSSTSPVAGTNVTFAITVSAVSGTATPAGTVSVSVDGGTATDYTLDSNGSYNLTVSFADAGIHTVTASYASQGNFAASGEASASVSVGSGGSGKGSIKLAATDISVSQGNTGTSTITITPSGGYTGTVLLNIDFGSQDSTLANLCYAFTTMDNNGNGTVQVTGASAVTTQLSLDTNAADCASPTGGVKRPNLRPLKVQMKGATHANNNHNGNLPAGLAFAGLLLAGFLGRHSRKLRGVACIIALAAIGFGLSACGSSSGGGNGDPPKGTYTGTITGTDQTTSSITSQTTFTFTIN